MKGLKMVTFKKHAIDDSLKDLSVQFVRRNTELGFGRNPEERIFTPRILSELREVESFTYRSAMLIILRYDNRIEVMFVNTARDMASMHSNIATVYHGITHELATHYRGIISYCLLRLSPVWLFNFGSSVIAKNGKLLRYLLENSKDPYDRIVGTLGEKQVTVFRDKVVILDKDSEIIFSSNSLDRLQKTMLKA